MKFIIFVNVKLKFIIFKVKDPWLRLINDLTKLITLEFLSK